MPILTIGSIDGLYIHMKRRVLDQNRWTDVYEDVALSTGETVAQIRVEYVFIEDRSSVSVYFESEDGHPHVFLPEIIDQMQSGV